MLLEGAYGVQIKRPESLGFNQVFARDIGVVIDDAFVLTSMVEDREQEQAGYHAHARRKSRNRAPSTRMMSDWKAGTSCPCPAKSG